jgi:membrane protease YdiL (CAAX protease family)
LDHLESSHRPCGAASRRRVTNRSIAGEFPAPWRAACAYGLLGAVLLLIVALPIATFWRGEPLTVETIGPLTLFAGQGVLATFLLLWFLLRRRAPLRSFLHLPRGHWAARVTEGIRIGVFGWLVTMAAMAVLGIVARAAGIAPHEGFAALMVWMARRPLPLRLALIAVAMVVEEAFFRAFLQPRVGLPIATLCFALSHVNYGSPIMSGGVLVIGWVLGHTFLRTQDLAVCAVAHGTFDAIQLLLILPLIAARM